MAKHSKKNTTKITAKIIWKNKFISLNNFKNLLKSHYYSFYYYLIDINIIFINFLVIIIILILFTNESQLFLKNYLFLKQLIFGAIFNYFIYGNYRYFFSSIITILFALIHYFNHYYLKNYHYIILIHNQYLIQLLQMLFLIFNFELRDSYFHLQRRN